MKFTAAAVGSLAWLATCAATKENPLSKVLTLLDDLEAKVTKEGEAEAKAFAEYTEFCDDASKNAEFAVKDATKQKGKLEAKIAELTSEGEVASSKIEDLAAAIASGEADLKDAATVRSKEAADFQAAEKELVESLDTLTRAISVLEKEMAKNPAFAQVDSANLERTLQAIGTVLDAASFASADKKKLQSLLQAKDSEEDDMSGPPAVAAYKSHSSNIVDVLEDLKEKAEEELSSLRKGETNAKHNYEMLKSSLEAQKAADNKDLSEQKETKASAGESKAAAEGDLETTVASLKNSEGELEATRTTCMTVAADHEATVAGRVEELKVIAEAKKVLSDTSSGAVSQTYSFVQLKTRRRIQTGADLGQFEVVTALRSLATKYHSTSLSQLASRVSAVVKFGSSSGEGPFEKVKTMISELIAKLEKEAESEATEKAYCDEEMAKTTAKKEELQALLAKLNSKIDSAAAKSAELKEEVRVLEGELAALAKEQAEMDKLRAETHAAYATAKEDLETGLTGVRKALRVLRDYYSSSEEEASFVQQPALPEKHSKAGGAGQSIVGLLEVVESDFATNLAKEEQQEADAASAYEKMTQENKVTTATKEQDVKYKTEEAKTLDVTISELGTDKASTTTELEAVLEYDGKIKERCIAKPETYEERTARRAAEIEGLKQALTTLNEETALLQRKTSRANMRGALLARD